MVVDLNRSLFVRPDRTRQLNAQAAVTLCERLRTAGVAHRVYCQAAPIQFDAVLTAPGNDDTQGNRAVDGSRSDVWFNSRVVLNDVGSRRRRT